MHTKTLYISLLLALPLFHARVDGQATIRPEIQRLVDSLVVGKRYESAFVGYAGVESKLWDYYSSLGAHATAEELRLLCDHPNGVVKCYSFQALLSNGDSAAFPILLTHLRDHQKVEQQSGCIVSTTSVADKFFQLAWWHWYENPDDQPSAQQFATIDSLLIFDADTAPGCKAQRLRGLMPDEKYHSILRAHVRKGAFPEAGIALARFQDPADIPLIANMFSDEASRYYACYATREFPHPDLFPHLVAVFDKEWKDRYYDYPLWRILMQALARYDVPKTMELFERSVSSKDGFRRRTLGKYVLIAITKYPHPSFESLKQRISLGDLDQSMLQMEMDAEE